jgi:hypothetical protein
MRSFTKETANKNCAQFHKRRTSQQMLVPLFPLPIFDPTLYFSLYLYIPSPLAQGKGHCDVLRLYVAKLNITLHTGKDYSIFVMYKICSYLLRIVCNGTECRKNLPCVKLRWTVHE